MRRKLSWLCLAAGFLLALIPAVSGILDACRQLEAVSTFRQSVLDLPARQVDQTIAQARDWDQARRSHQPVDLTYEQVLDLTGTGVMATLSIPKIGVNLPVQHGTEEEVLSNAAGHVEFSNLPIGGIGTRCILSAHRGLPSARLFTRLDELQEGDLFFLQTGDRKLAYEVTDIQVIRPEETEKLEPVPDKDLVSLVTCTPYGINTHRLVVTGQRTDVPADREEKERPVLPSGRELLFLAAPLAFGAAGAVILFGRKEKQ